MPYEAAQHFACLGRGPDRSHKTLWTGAFALQVGTPCLDIATHHLRAEFGVELHAPAVFADPEGLAVVALGLG